MDTKNTIHIWRQVKPIPETVAENANAMDCDAHP